MSKPFNIRKVMDINPSNYSVDKIIDEPITERDNHIYTLEYINNVLEKRSNEAEDYEVCSFFGCGKKLRLEETLAGSRCCEHSGE